ncbi:MAG: ABC transporter permease, partial [Pseudomonadota bacterium]
MAGLIAQQDRAHAALLLSPAYLWLTVAVFLPLSAMAYFSFLSDIPFGDREWHVTLDNYRAFFETGTYATLLWKSIKLGATVTLLSVIIGFPCAFVLAKVIKGRSREALFLLVILPFWSNSLVRIFSWAIVLRG